MINRDETNSKEAAKAPYVINVGLGVGGRKQIVAALTEAGFNVERVNEMWPRDDHVNYGNGKTIYSSAPGSAEGNAFGEGGLALTGKGYALISDGAIWHDNLSKYVSGKISFEKVVHAIKKEGEEHLPDTRIHVAPTGYFHGGYGKGHNDHLDLFALLIPDKHLLIVDTHHGGRCVGSYLKEYSKICEEEGLKLILYDGSQDGVWYPLNTPVFPTENGEVVVVDNKAKSLMNILEEQGVNYVPVKDFPQVDDPHGKIRCMTNIHNLEQKLLNR